MLLEVILGTLAIYLLYRLYHRPRKLDLPGPRGVPILGNLLQLDPKAPHLKLSEWHDKYGDVYTLRLLSENWVVLGDYETIHQVLVTEGLDYAGRPDLFRFHYMSRGRKDIFSQSPDENFWKIGRKIMHRNIKQYSSGMASIEEVINQMTSRFITRQKSFEGRPRDPSDDIYNYVLSNLMHLSFGRSFDETDPLFGMAKNLERTVIVIQSMTGRGTELDMFPWLRFFGNWTFKKMKEAINLQTEIWSYAKPLLLKQMDQENPKCLMEAFILAHQNQPESTKDPFDDINVLMILLDIFVAGITTSSHTIMSLLLVLLHYPDIMQRLQKEVDTVVGPYRQVALTDRDNMPYTRAVVLEILRFSSVVVLSVPHAAMKDTQLRGANIPKDTTVITNLWHLHHDEKFWNAPWEFKPERFLDEAEQLLPPDHPNRKHLMPFGAGTRVCVGEIFAITRLFMFIASLMQNFDVLPDPDSEPPSCDPRTYELGIVIAPAVGKIRMVPRV